MLKLYNSLTGQKETLPHQPGDLITMYVCGITVYDYCHVGHARGTFVVYDAFVRFLKALGYRVKFVRNITDIDDKIIRRAEENKEKFSDLTQRFITAMHEDEKALGVASPDLEPRATEYIPQMIELIQTLIKKDFAYVASNGDVCYAVEHFAEYGKLSHRSLKDLEAGARVEVNENKNNPLDFVLWKLAKPGEPAWNSPWGEGRPGWHIECSAMVLANLDLPFDIHGGGVDLKFPHHENELAQSEAACGCEYVRTWMHVGHVQVSGEKMAKSVGNFITIRDALKKYHSETIRYFLLSAHYRQPLNFSAENLENAEAGLMRFYTALRSVKKYAVKPLNFENTFTQKFTAALEDDFNTPEAFSILFAGVRELNRLVEQNEISASESLASELVSLAAILGIVQELPESFLKGNISSKENAEIEALIAERETARKTKDWKKSDAIRAELLSKGIVLEDSASGVQWKKA